MAGKFFEDLNVGDRFRHATGRTVTEMDNVLFSALSLNTQPLHINEDFAAQTQFGRRIVTGLFTLALVVGLRDAVRLRAPVFLGDTLYAETEVLEKRESKSRPEAGLVRLKQIGRKADGTVVVELERTVLFLKRPAEPGS